MINNENKSKDVFEKIELVFKILFLVYTMIGYNSFLFGNKIISVIMWPMLVLGMVLLLWRVIHLKEYIKTPGTIGMLLFCISFVISMMINLKYEFKQNIISFVFIVFYFGILYLQNKSDQEVEKEFKLIGKIYLTYMVLSVIWSFVLFFNHYGEVKVVNDDSYELIAGFVWGRLWGVFLDPNVGSIMACIAIVIAVWFFAKSEKKVYKIFYGISILLQIFYIAFSDSRTGMLCLACLVFLEIYCVAYKKIRGMGVRKWLVLVMICGIISVVAFFIPKGITKGYNYVANMWDNAASEDNILITRGYDLSEDPSNRRFDIWKSGLEIFNENKVFGTSYNGIRPYAYEYMPNTYIVNNDFQQIRNLHNEFLNVLVSQGIIGILSLILMIVPIVILVLKRLFSKSEKEKLGYALFIGVAVTTVGTMFTSAGYFYYVCPYSIMFWLMMGYLQRILMNGDKS